MYAARVPSASQFKLNNEPILIRAIKQLVGEWRDQDEAFKPFILEVEQFIQSFQVRKIHQWVESLLEEAAL